MGMHVERIGLSRPLRKLSESPAEDLIAAGTDGDPALQSQRASDQVHPFFHHDLGNCESVIVAQDIL